jgi:SPP1 gp7 family putative phage head morphogenesis protein
VATANEILQDGALRHAIDVQRYTRGEARRILSLLEASDAELIRTLERRLGALPVPVDFRSARLLSLRADIRRARTAVMARLQGTLTQDLQGFASVEATDAKQLLEFAVPIEYQFASVSLEQLRSVVTEQPFQGRNLGDWWRRLQTADQDRVMDQIQLGYSQGESVPNIMRRIRGTRAAGYRDGVLGTTRRNAETVVRTAVNHVSNAARDAVWDANADVIDSLRWLSTLDGRTTLICMRRDGHLAPVGDKPLPPDVVPLTPPGARPPAHPNCRSVMVPFISETALLGDRPFVRTTQRRGAREVDFRRMAREQGRSVSAVRRDWGRENIGTIPKTTNYEEFLRRQPAAFQDRVLGDTKGALFRRGGLKIDKFVDARGTEFTLEQLASRHPGAFAAANLDPADFLR